jgi:Na(+)-translocating NADH:ubiquinone oxidoreductase F subunit
VVSNRNVTPYIKELVLEPMDGMPFQFEPGQYIQLIIPPHKISFTGFHIEEPFRRIWEQNGMFELSAENTVYLRRNYSLATNPSIERQLKFNVRIALPREGKTQNAGAGSSYVFSLKPGDEVKLTGPFGDFLIRKTEKEKVYIGGGAGMAPIRSHLSYLLETLGTREKVSFWYGARSVSDMFYADYFEAMQEKHPNFSFRVALSDLNPEEEWSGRQGFIHQVLNEEYLADHPNPQTIEYYLCGPPAMIKATLKMLEEIGVPSKMIAFDEF